MRFAGPLATVNRMLTQQGQLVRGTHWLGAIGRMKPGVTVEEVQADMSTVARQMEQTYPETNAGWGATVVPVLDQTVGTIRGAAARAARRRRVRADHRDGERRQPRARAKHRAAEGAGNARCARRRPRAHDSSRR